MEQELADFDKPDKPDRPVKGGNTGPAKGPAAAEPKKTTDPGEGELPGLRDA